MSIRLVSEAPRAALFGKLPAHGDFVRRGDPDLVQALDGWLTAEVDRFAVGAGYDLDARLSELPTWCFRLPGDISGALAASRDKVGRIYPVIATADAQPGGAQRIAELLTEAQEQGLDADETKARLIVIATEAPAADAVVEEEGWWRASDPATRAAAVDPMPTGADFARLFDGEG
ncbi:type VI secretion system-associated protein TagF [Sphingomonas sp.]|uniref:type VI secretion system-associated protein TagF n=1 Tax=Sphingomonas sp. TaxID=28214 RepID=UPI003B3BC457